MIVIVLMSGGLRRFDGFKKLADEYRVGTVSGGALSLCALLTALAVFGLQIRDYINPPLQQRFVLDTRRPVGPDGKTISSRYQAALEVNFQITFPHVPCFLLHFDAIETSANLPLPLQQSMVTFTRLRNRNRVGQYTTGYLDVNTERCGSCYGIGNATCCNSCGAVLRQYRQENLRYPILSEVDQCVRASQDMKSMEGEGCTVNAHFKTVRIKAEFHVSPGMSSEINGSHFHDVRPFGWKWLDMNLTHTIDRFDFGSRSTEPGQLSGFTSVQDKVEYWRVVYMTNVMADDYTSQRYLVRNSSVLYPGVSVEMDISPIYAETVVERGSVLQLLSKMVMSAGGTVFMFWILDATFYRGTPAKKLED